MIIYRTGNFGLAIHEWNCTSTVQNKWVGFKQLFWTSHQELHETTLLTVQDTGIHHANIFCDVVAGLKEVLQQEQALTETPLVFSEPSEHVVNAVQNTQHQLAAQHQQIQSTMKNMQIQHAATLHPFHQEYEGCGYYRDHKSFRGRGGHSTQC